MKNVIRLDKQDLCVAVSEYLSKRYPDKKFGMLFYTSTQCGDEKDLYAEAEVLE